jgi:hypothetical protein
MLFQWKRIGLFAKPSFRSSLLTLWVRPQYNEPLEVLTMLISNAFHFSIPDLKIIVQHQGFILVGGCWLGFRVFKYVFFA